MSLPRRGLAALACCWTVATLGALLTPQVSAADAPRYGTKVMLEPGGTRSAGELTTFPDTRVFPRNQEPRAREESPRNQEGPKHKSTNPDSPRRAAGAVRAGAPSISLTSPLAFDGPTLNDAAAYPPDTQGDVGPTQFIVMINGRVRSYNKSTGLADGVLDADTDAFWSSVMTPPTNNNFTSDPHIRYDRLSGRWIAVMIDVPGLTASQSNRIMIAISDSSTITSASNFHFYSIPEGTSGEFADYPTLGIDKNALYIGTNQFATTGQGAFSNCNVYVVNKASLLAGTPTATRFDHVINNQGAGPYTPQGVDNDDPAASTGYFVGVDNTQFGKLDLVSVANPDATPTISQQSLTVPATAFPIGGVPEQGGSSLDDLDDRLYAAQMHAGHIFTAHNIGVTSTGAASTSAPTRDGSRWYEINPATPSLTQSGTVFDPASSNPASYWIPTVGVSPQGIMAIGGSVSGTTRHPNAWYAARAPGDTAGTVGGLTTYTNASATYNPPYDRWGDYSLTRFDPQDGMTLWTIQEYVSGTDVWGTKIAKLRAPAPPTPSGSASVPAAATHTDLTISGTSQNGVGYFDPGPSFPNRLQLTLTGCAVTVNSITTVTPGSVTADVDTTGAAPGDHCDVTITNPDGQSASGIGAVTVGGQPTAAFTVSPSTATRGQTVNFDGSASHDAEAGGAIQTYAWDFGDGSTQQTTSPTTTHAYTALGTFAASLVVTDVDESATSDAASHSVTVQNVAPTAQLSFSPGQPQTGQTVSFSAAGSSDSDGSIVTYRWDLDGDGVFETVTGQPTTTRSYSTVGTFTVRMQAQDNDGGTATATAAVPVTAPASTGTQAPSGSDGSTPPPAPSGGGTTPATTAPAMKLVLTTGSKLRLASLLKRGLASSIRCARSCTVKVTLRIPQSVARRTKAARIVGRATITVTGSGTKRVRLRLTRTARKRLARAGRFTLTLTGTASDSARHSSSAKRSVKITR